MNTELLREATPTPTAYLCTADTERAIRFYEAAFGARELFRLRGPDGRIGHAEIAIGSARLMLADEFPEYGAVSPETLGGSPVKLHLYVDDCDAVVEQALQAGATLLRPVRDQFYGDRCGVITDPLGYSWLIATRREEVSPDEMQRRWWAAEAKGE